MNQERPRQPFRFTDPRQERIHDRLNRLVGPGAAQFFFDAADFMASEQPPRTATHLVAHALREIESALRDVLEPYMDWEKLERERKKRRNGQPESESHREEIKAILKGLKIPDDEPVAVAWLRMPGRDTEFALNRRAHRRDLAPARPLDSKFREFWADMVAILDVVLDRFESRYLELLPVLDELLQVDNPGETEAKRLKLHIPNNLNAHRYFFDPLSRSSWLEPLHKAGMFDHPPQPLLDEEQGTISFLPWPESRYLARMAAQDPDIVSAIIHDIPETMNAYVHEDLADAACALPPDLAARWAEKEAQWVRRQDRLYFSVPERLAALAGHLARSGRADRALDLASALLGFLPAESATADRGEELDLREAEPRIRFPTYD